MPIPFLIAGAATIAGAAGVVKGTEAIINNQEAEQLLAEATEVVEKAQKNFAVQKERSTKSLDKLGDIKINVWSEHINSFVEEFNFFKNVRLENNLIIDKNIARDIATPNQLVVKMTDGAMTAKEILQVGTVSLGAGAVIGVAAYGGVMLLGKASTGTAIATLSGAAVSASGF